MKSVISTRLIHLKYNWLHVLFWLLFPLLITFIINHLVLAVESDTKLPISVIQEENTEMSEALLESIKMTDYLRVVDLDKKEALNQLKKNELEAVFVIKSDYERQIKRGGRNKLVEAYESDLSLAFIPIAETLTSYIQQDAGRSKAFFELTDLNTKYNQETTIDLNDYIQMSKEKEASENLLETSLVYSDEKIKTTDQSFVKPVSIWLISYVLSVFMLFDWIIKESSKPITNRFTFLKVNYKRYLLYNLFIYSFIIFITSFISLFILNINLSLLPLMTFQFSVNSIIFLIATRFRKTFTYYAFAIGSTLLIMVVSGLFIPVNQLLSNSMLFDLLNPFTLMLQNKSYFIGLMITILLLLIWSIRKEKSNA